MNYLIRKLQLKALFTLALHRVRRSPGIYCCMTGPVQSIGLDLSGPHYAHLGDHLFYQPLLLHLERHKLQVCVAPTAPMRGYFAAHGHRVVTSNELAACDVVITPVWGMLDQPIERRFRSCLYVNATDPTIDAPLCTYLIREVCSALGLPTQVENDRPPCWTEAQSTLVLESGARYVLFNNYVDSGRFRIHRQSLASLRTALAELKAEGVHIIHVGSTADRNDDAQTYPEVDLDLRGVTSVADLFHLAAHPQVTDVVAFDNFVMHLGLLNGKRCHIRIRPHTPRMADYLRRCVNPPFDAPDVRAAIRYLK